MFLNPFSVVTKESKPILPSLTKLKAQGQKVCKSFTGDTLSRRHRFPNVKYLLQEIELIHDPLR